MEIIRYLNSRSIDGLMPAYRISSPVIADILLRIRCRTESDARRV